MKVDAIRQDSCKLALRYLMTTSTDLVDGGIMITADVQHD